MTASPRGQVRRRAKVIADLGVVRQGEADPVLQDVERLGLASLQGGVAGRPVGADGLHQERAALRLL